MKAAVRAISAQVEIFVLRVVVSLDGKEVFMSGPKTSHYSIRAVRRQEQERRQAEEQQRRQAEERKRREELAARLAIAENKRSELEKRAGRLSMAVGELRGRFPTEKIDIAVPDCDGPQSEDPGKMEDFVLRLESDLVKAETTLRNVGEQAKANDDFRGATRYAAALSEGSASTAEEAMRRFVESRAPKRSESSMTDRRAEIDRILARQGLENWKDATPKLESLVMEALSVESENRFSALATEIRLQVQEVKRREETRRADAEKAKVLLDRLELEIPSGEDSLKQRLELVRVGAILFSDDFEKMARGAIAKAEVAAKVRIQTSATNIVKETLADLGYDVAPIEETLFARGGKVYFRKAGWDNYCVRLTVRPDESKMNFNVVRIVEQVGDQESSSREADIKAENAWCSGYQQFVDTLAARGLDTQLTRHLPVGAIPVQAVGNDEISLAGFGPQEKKRKLGKTAKVRGGDSR